MFLCLLALTFCPIIQWFRMRYLHDRQIVQIKIAAYAERTPKGQTWNGDNGTYTTRVCMQYRELSKKLLEIFLFIYLFELSMILLIVLRICSLYDILLTLWIQLNILRVLINVSHTMQHTTRTQLMLAPYGKHKTRWWDNNKNLSIFHLLRIINDFL